MHVTSLALASLMAASQAQAPAQKYAVGQEIRVCGEVKTQRTAAPPACDTVIRVASAGEVFDVTVPASVAKELSLAPQRMRGADACFTGRVTSGAGVPMITLASRSGVEVLGTAPDASFAAEAAVPCGANVTMPVVVQERKPAYTSSAMREGAQGSVEMQAVVDVDGTVTQARVVRAVHPDLDEEALKAVRAWRFVPGTVNGKPAPVLVDIEMSFALSPRRR